MTISPATGNGAIVPFRLVAVSGAQLSLRGRTVDAIEDGDRESCDGEGRDGKVDERRANRPVA
jgi:hypothetical protein